MKRNKSQTLSNQELFVKNHKKHHKSVFLWRSLLLLFFLVIWELSARLDWIDSFFFSCPSMVVTCTLRQFQENHMLYHIFITLFETIASFLLVMFFSLLVATLLWNSKKISEIIEPYLVILNSLPKSALAPLFIVWLGTGIKTIIIAGISVAIFGSVLSFYTAFQQVDPSMITLIYTLGGKRKDAFIRVILPASLPILINTAKINIGLSLVGVIIGEFLAARNGLGYLIIYGSQIFRLDMVITSIIILCVIALLFYKLIQCLEHRIKIKFKQ